MKFTYPPDAKPVDGFTIRRGLHRGGFGEVYYAVSDAGKEVALKLLTHDLDTELRGIRQCLNLKHSNLVTIFDVRTDADGDTWVVMEYVSGASLEDVLAAFPMGLPLDEVRDWMLGILAGVEYLHSRGIVHRDLKPANIYRENGVVKIGDVGLSKQMGGTRRQHTEAIGTVYYMAPEVAKGQYGPEVDVYSLGVMLFELLTGQLPFDGETTAEIMMKHLTGAPDLSGVPAAYRPVIARALEKDPEKRTRSAHQLRDELQQALRFEPIPESAFEPPPAASNGSSSARATKNGAGTHEKVPFIQPEPRHGGQWNRPADPDWRKSSRSIVDDVLVGVRSHVRDRVDRVLDRERRRQERRMARANAKAAKPVRVPRKDEGRSWGAWWPWLALAVLVFVPWHTMSWGDVGEVAGIIACWGGLVFALHLLTSPHRWQQPVDVPSTPDASVVAPLRVSWLEQLAASWLIGILSASLLTVVGIFTWMRFEPSLSLLQLNDFAWLIIASCLGTLVVLTSLLGLQHPKTATANGGHWLPLCWIVAGMGLALGAAVGGLDEFLAVRDAVDGPVRPAFRHIGSHSLSDGGHLTTVAYMAFFAATLWLQKWEQNLHRFRPYRLRLGPVAWAALIGFLGSLFFGVPGPFAILWSTAITTAAQIAAPWEPERRTTSIPVEAA